MSARRVAGTPAIVLALLAAAVGGAPARMAPVRVRPVRVRPVRVRPARVAADAVAGQWIAAWTSSMQASLPMQGSNYTCREIERVMAGGSAIRVRLSNRFGPVPLTFGAVDVGLRAAGLALVPGSHRRVTFGGATSVTISPGQEKTSDAVALPVRAGQDVALSLYVPGATTRVSFHLIGLVTSGCTTLSGRAGDHTADAAGSAFGDPLSHQASPAKAGSRSN